MARPRVLLIDEGSGDRGLLVQMLRPRDYDLFIADRSPESVVKLLGECSPHLLILDMAMVGLDPIDVLLAVRRVDTKLPVIVVNASASASAVLKTLTLGNCDYLFRPLDGERLCGLIESMVGPKDAK